MPKVLVVDDDEIIHESLRLILYAHGDLTCVLDGPAALRALDETDFDVVMVDQVLPGEMLGNEVCHRIRDRWSGMPIVLMSEFVPPGRLVRMGESVLATVVHTKPFKIKLLQHQIEALTRLRKFQRSRAARSVVPLDDVKREAAAVALRESGVQIRPAAKALGIGRNTLKRLMARLRLGPRG